MQGKIIFLFANKFFKNVARFKHMETVTNKTCIHEEITS